MAEYTIKVRRYQPESGEAAYWEEFGVDLDPSLSVLDGLLQTKDRQDGSLAVRCSCRAVTRRACANIWRARFCKSWWRSFLPPACRLPGTKVV